MQVSINVPYNMPKKKPKMGKSVLMWDVKWIQTYHSNNKIVFSHDVKMYTTTR